MGGNGSYNKAIGGVPIINRTHEALSNRIEGHKILVKTINKAEAELPMNSNSRNPLYLCAKIKKGTNIVKITTVGIYKHHKLVAAIDLKFDRQGNIIPFANNGEKSSHFHRFFEYNEKTIGRKPHDFSNFYPIPKKYKSIVNKINQYNQEKHYYHGKQTSN